MSKTNIKSKHCKLKLAFASMLTAVVAVLGFSGSVSAWGPSRTTYTNENPAPYATFNSITNNAAVGDERNFVRVRELGNNAKYSDEVEVTPGKEYEVYIYYHNNAATNTNASGVGVATAVKASSAYPTVLHTNERGMISGIISWSYVENTTSAAKNGQVWDEAYLTTKTDGVVLRYKTGTATIHNGGAANGSVLSSDLFTTSGTYLGYDKLGGVLPGCAKYSGYITYTLVAEKTSATISKKVSLDGTTWVDKVNVRPGDYVTYRVMFENTGNTNLTNVIFKDVHDNGLSLRTGSTKIFNAANVNGKTIDDILDISGYNTGDLAAGALVQVVYQAQVSTDKNYCKKTLKNTITASYNSNQSMKDSANVYVVCEEETPAETCETNPNLPECQKPDCTTNPELPECQKPDCTTNPELPECQKPDCTTNPELPECQKPTCATNPEMEGCQEIPSTGPVEVVLAAVVIAGILGGGFYLYNTRKTLKTVESAVKGEGKSEGKHKEK